MHVDVHVRCGRGVVHEAVAAVAMHDPGERVHRRTHAGDVGAGGEGADLQRAAPVPLEELLQGGEVHLPALVGRDDLHRRHRLQPGGLVGVMLHVRQEHEGPKIVRELAERRKLLG